MDTAVDTHLGPDDRTAPHLCAGSPQRRDTAQPGGTLLDLKSAASTSSALLDFTSIDPLQPELQSSGGAIEQSPEPRPALGEVEGTSRLSGATIPVSGPAPYDTCLEYAPPPLASGPFSHPASSLWLPDLTTLDVASLAPDHGLSSALPSSLSDSSTSLAPQQLPAAPYGRSSALELLPPCPLDHLLPPLPLFAPDPVAPLAVSAAAPDGLRQTGTEGLSACGASPLGAPPDHEGIGTSGEAYTDGQLADGWEGGEAVGGKRLAEGVPDSLAEDSLEGDESLDPAGAAARPCKRPRLVWTPELHTRFLNAVNHLGVKNAVPKTILQLMNVEGMTRENVASHLQKYRLHLKRTAGYPAEARLSPDALQQLQQEAMQQAQQAQQEQLAMFPGLTPLHMTGASPPYATAATPAYGMGPPQYASYPTPMAAMPAALGPNSMHMASMALCPVAWMGHRGPMTFGLPPCTPVIQMAPGSLAPGTAVPQLVQHAIPMVAGPSGSPQWVWGAPSNAAGPMSATASPT